MNIYNEFRKTAINRYSKTALVMMNDEGETKEYTFGQTLQQADIFCSRLKAMGVVAGDRVCIASEGRPEWNIAFLACAKLNTTAVLLDYFASCGRACRTGEKVTACVRCRFSKGGKEAYKREKYICSRYPKPA